MRSFLKCSTGNCMAGRAGLITFVLIYLLSCSPAKPGNQCLQGNCENEWSRLKLENGQLYEGQFTSGAITGYGLMVYADQSVYEGFFKNGKRHGYGGYKIESRQYIGEFQSDKFRGFGVYVFYNAGVPVQYFAGNWRNNQLNGLGWFQAFDDGRFYAGQFKNDEFTGNGYLDRIEPDQNTQYRFRYVGDMQNGRYHGEGILFSSDGRVYSGIWEKGELIRGAMVVLDMTGIPEDYYRGAFEKLEPMGQGKWRFHDGRLYVGEFRDGKFHGQGTFHYPSNGYNAQKRYDGKFESGEFHGQGVLTYQDGRKQTGLFEHGKYVKEK